MKVPVRSNMATCQGWAPYLTWPPVGVVVGVRGMLYLKPQPVTPGPVQHNSVPGAQVPGEIVGGGTGGPVGIPVSPYR